MSFKNLVFAGHLDGDEKILYVAHRHSFVLFKASFRVMFFGMILPVLFYLLFPSLVFAFLIWFCFGFFGMLYHFMDWYFDAWLITSVGIIDIERNGLFDRNSTRVDYHMIEGIALSISGFWNTVLNFGDITLDKLGAQTSLVLNDASNPKKIERIVLKYQDKYVSERSVRDHETLKSLLSEMIAYHVHNNKINKK